MGTRTVALLGVLAGMAAASQLAGAWFPAAGGLVAGLGPLPVALAAVVAPRWAHWAATAALAATAAFSAHQAAVFALLHGPLGLAVGLCVARRAPRLLAVAVAGSAVFAGLLALELVLGVHPLAAPVRHLGAGAVVAVQAVFAAAYGWAWHRFVDQLAARLAPVLAPRHGP